ncbi:hypothetical protein D3C76_922710 [compost metagenome]
MLHFAGVHVEPAGNDHFLLAIDDEHVTLRIDLSQVAGEVVAVTHDFGGERRCAPIALHHVRALDHDLADFAGGHIFERLVDHPQVGLEVAPPAGGQALIVAVFHQVVLLGQHRDQRAGFTSAVPLHQNRPEQFDGLLHQGWRHGRGTVHDQLQAGQVEALDARVIDQPVDHRRHQEQPRHPFALDGLQQQAVVVTIEQQVAGAHRQQRHDLHAAGMGDRADVGHDIVRAGAAHRAGQALAHQGLAVAEGQHRGLEHPGTARGVVQHRQVIVVGIAVEGALIAHVEHFAVRDVAAFLSQYDDPFKVRQCCAVCRQRFGRRTASDHCDATGVVEHADNFIRRQARIDRHLDHGCLVEGHFRLHQLDAVHGQDRHMGAGRQAQLQQPRSQAVAAGFELCVGQALAAVDNRLVMRPVTRTSAQYLSEVHFYSPK